MKFLKNTLAIATLFIICSLNAKQTGAKTTPTTTIIPQPQITPKPVTTYKALLDEIRAMKKQDIFNNSGLFTDNTIQFVIRIKNSNLSKDQIEALVLALLYPHMTWTNNFDDDE